MGIAARWFAWVLVACTLSMATLVAFEAPTTGARAPFDIAAPARLQAGQPAPAEEFVPIDELPPEERLPAARLLIAAYVVAWLIPLWYVWSLWRRLGAVEKDLSDLHRRRRDSGRT